MADSMIVEVRDLRGRLVTRHPVVGSQIRVGRAFDNDVILDDPHADAHHAVLDLNLAGRSVRVSDLGSLNGTRLGRRPATAEGDEWPFGAPIEIGRTTITFFAADTPVPQATPLQSKLVRRVSASPARSLALSAAVALYVMVTTWFTDYQENGWVSWGGAALGILFVLYLWAGGWAVGAKLASRPAGFLSHLGWLSAFLLVAMPAGTVMGYASYLFPTSTLVVLSVAVATWLLASALLFGHLELVSQRPTRFKLLLSGGGVAVVAALVFFAGTAEEDHMTPVSDALGTLRWMPTAAVPTTSIDAFTADLSELRNALDEDALDVTLR